MGKELVLGLLLALLRCPQVNTDSQISCPLKCHCFSPLRVMCLDGGMPYLPRNTSGKVQEFIIVSSQLQYLFSHSLATSPHLTKLVFLNNALQSIHAHAFEHLVELQELEISGNPKLDHLFLETFAKQGNLTKLMLNYNSFNTVLPSMFDDLSRLEILQMKGNAISELPAFLFRNLENLRFLDLSLNKLRGVQRETFSGLAGLEVLKMNNNLIGNLSSDAFHNVSQLTELHLEGNKISELADDTFELANLKVLNLRGNLLTTFSDKVFGSMASNLTELNLRGNRLTEVSPLSSLTSLSSLILSSNRLHSLPEDIFRNMTALDYLDLSENQLTLLPETVFIDLTGIKAIHLNRNNLSKLEPRQFEGQALIQQLYLSDNRLETLPTGLFEPFAIQHTVRLHGNPWRCDCNMWYLHDWALRNTQAVETLDRMLCESPLFLRRRPVASIDKEQLVCRLSKESDLNRCSQETDNDNDTVIIKCKVDKCSPVRVKVQFQEDDGSIREHVLKNEPSHCGNETLSET